MELNLNLERKPCDETLPYRQIIGSLMYVMEGTRPYISYATNYLSRFQSYFDQTQFKHAK